MEEVSLVREGGGSLLGMSRLLRDSTRGKQHFRNLTEMAFGDHSVGFGCSNDRKYPEKAIVPYTNK